MDTAAWTSAIGAHLRGARRVVLIGSDALATPLREELHAGVEHAPHDALRAGGYDAAVLDEVVWRLPDRAGTAAELATRLTRPATVCIRESFAARLDGIVYLRYFPTALAIAERTLPSVEDTVAAFGRAGFEFVVLEPVNQTTATAGGYAAMIGRRDKPLLRDISDTEFERGLRELREETSEAPDTAIVEWMDLLVMRLP